MIDRPKTRKPRKDRGFDKNTLVFIGISGQEVQKRHLSFFHPFRELFKSPGTQEECPYSPHLKTQVFFKSAVLCILFKEPFLRVLLGKRCFFYRKTGGLSFTVRGSVRPKGGQIGNRQGHDRLSAYHVPVYSSTNWQLSSCE